jgi:hypothetical protein
MFISKFLPHAMIALVILGALSCNDDWFTSEYDTTVKWEGGLEAPIIHGRVTLEELLEEYDTAGYVFPDENNLLWASYTRDTVLTAPEMIDIPDQDFIQVFFRVDSNISGAWLGPVGDTIMFEQDKGFEFERTGEERLDSVHVKSGEMRVYVRSSIRHAGILRIYSDHILLNGKEYDTSIVISDPSGMFEETIPIPIPEEGGTIRLDNNEDSTFLNLLFQFNLINSGNDILVSEELQIINSFHDLEFSGAYGYIGDYDSTLVPVTTLSFDLLDVISEGEISLANPQIHLQVDNSMGVPFEVQLDSLEAYFKDGTGTVISIDPGANPIRIDAPGLLQIGETVRSETSIDSTNSNISVAATTNLNGFQYSVDVRANPDGEVENFILDTSRLDISVQGLVPLDLRIQEIILADTFDFSPFSDDEESEIGPDDIDSVRMDMITRNHMPLNLSVQVYFMDSTQVDANQDWLLLDSLFSVKEPVLVAGEIDAGGKVISPAVEPTRADLSRSQIENIMDANKLLLRAYVKTVESQTRDVKFYAGDYLEFEIGMRVKLKMIFESEQNK